MTKPRANDLSELRREYRRHAFTEKQADPDPLVQFQKWFDEAVAAGVEDPSAMTLATVDTEGRPSARIVLLKGLDQGGFVFFTNYGSRKGRELTGSPHAALVFYWHVLERQVRVQGDVKRVSAEESAAYFVTRPRTSRISAWASQQSTPLASRAELEAEFARRAAEFSEGDVPTPPHWGGYRLLPERVEFWQGRENRLHDRLEYERAAETWRVRRLAP